MNDTPDLEDQFDEPSIADLPAEEPMKEWQDSAEPEPEDEDDDS